jgi:hypothetical protein
MTIVGRLRARIDRGQNRGGADTPEAGHDDQAPQGALHFAANELEERHSCDVVRLTLPQGADPDESRARPLRPQQHSIALRLTMHYDAL